MNMSETIMNKDAHATTWNVINEDAFRDRLRFVFEKVATSLANTLGPYGSTSILERMGECHVTKDGWNVLKSMRFNDPVDNNILTLLVRISAQVVIQVGDGSTSAIVAANEILKKFEENKEILDKYRPKDLIQKMNEIVEVIADRIYKNSTKIDNGHLDIIFRIADIATNGDEIIPTMIRDIYEKTNNPTIEYRESKTNETYAEISNGYSINDCTYLDTIFTTKDDGTCVINKPFILMFDYKIDVENALDLISTAAAHARDNATRLVVIAPQYDRILLDHIRRTVTAEYSSTRSSLCVYCRASLVSNASHVLYNDFAVMAGATILHEQFDDECKKNELDTLTENLGMVEQITIGPASTMVSGFTGRNEAIYEKVCEDARAKFNKVEEDYRNRGIVDTALTDAKNRLTKLSGSMGIIHVGGASTLEKRANYDLVEDAIKACESAFRYGYNIGGNLIIPYTIEELFKDGTLSETGTESELANVIESAFLNVFGVVLSNKFYGKESEKVDEITETLYQLYTSGRTTCFDLITDSYSEDIINSCRTDIEILRAAISVVSLLYTSNQYVSIMDVSNK